MTRTHLARLVAILALAAFTAPPAQADYPTLPDEWTEFATASDAADFGWYVLCPLSQSLVVDTDAAAGTVSVGCQAVQARWSNCFGLALPAPLDGMVSLRFSHKTTWTTHDFLDWHVYLEMEPTANELAAGIDRKQLIWQYAKAEDWTEATLTVADATWQWRDADSGMWAAVNDDGTTELTRMITLEWYTNIPFGLEIGTAKRIDDLAFVGAGTAAPQVQLPRARMVGLYPNPANPAVTVAFTQPTAGTVDVILHDAAGRVVRRLAQRWFAAGGHSLRWNGLDDSGHTVPSGVYLVQLGTATGRETGVITLVR